jgi:membrane protein
VAVVADERVKTREAAWKRAIQWFWTYSECGEPVRKRPWPQRVVCYLRRLSDAYMAHQCGLMACACAYCALLSLVPVLIVGIAVLGFVVGGSQQALDGVIHTIRGYIPISPLFLRETLGHVLQDRRIIGVFGMIGLIYAAHQTFLALQPAMNLIWVVPETRHWAQQRLIALGATFLTIVLLGADLIASSEIAGVLGQDLPLLSIKAQAMLLRVGLGLVPLLLTTLLFALLYKTLPAREVSWKPALVGAVVAALLWEATKILFGLFVVYSHSYDRLYGSLSSLVILFVWMYYSMAILLLGAEIAADYESMRQSARAAEARSHSGADLGAAHARPTESRTEGTGT